MKKTLTMIVILTLLLSLLSSSILAQSPPVPSPIIGTVTLNGERPSGNIVDVTNLRTSQTVSGDTGKWTVLCRFI